jgi:hypothetical protein
MRIRLESSRRFPNIPALQDATARSFLETVTL